VSKHILKSNNSLPSPNQNKKEYYETKRKEYLKILKNQPNKTLSINLIQNELEKQPTEGIINFVDIVESRVNNTISKSNPGEDSRLFILQDLFFCLEDSTITTGNLLISQKININKDVFDAGNPKSKVLQPLLNVASFLLNYINLHNTGLLNNNIGFDGYSFFHLNNGRRIQNNSLLLHKTNLSNAERDLQSNFVVNEDFAMSLLSTRKKHMKIRGKDALIYNTVEDGQQFKIVKTLFKPQFCKNEIRDASLKDDLKLGYFVKVKKINLCNNTYEIILYYYCDEQLQHGIQLFRTDKVEPSFKGLPASHILRGGEKLYTSLHMHLYNVIDATLKHPDKASSLGAMDIAYNFLNPGNITIDSAEEFFNKSCGIYNKTLIKQNTKSFSI
jgi:hypothetical protein